MKASILLVEDDTTQRQLVAGLLQKEGYGVREAGTVDEAKAHLQAGDIDLVISDWQLGHGDGMDLLTHCKQLSLPAAFIMVTAYGTISHAVDALRKGADDYLPKPFEAPALLLSVSRALRSTQLEAENRRLNEALTERESLVDLIGRAPSMQRLYRRIEKLANTQATVLLQGESGTGKELVARAIHRLSARKDGPFVAVNCGGIPEGLMESEFLGAEKGAYTGADRSRPGKFEQAQDGTLFLDEIGELPLAIQPKLLRALQEGQFTRVGGSREIETNARLIAATNRRLEEAVQSGEFREDLYYRLNVVPIELPPLRNRREDIPLLIRHFTKRTERLHGVTCKPFSKQLTRRFLDHPWPGNVRELGNVVERLILLADDGIANAEDLPHDFGSVPSGGQQFELPVGGMDWHQHEKDALKQALEQAHHNRAAAARLLKLPYKAFLYRLEKYGLTESG